MGLVLAVVWLFECGGGHHIYFLLNSYQRCYSFSWCLFYAVSFAADALSVDCACSCSCGPGRVLVWWRRRQLLRTTWVRRRLFWVGRTAPLVIFWVCLGLSPLGVGSVDVALLTGVLLRVFRWWMRFTFRSVRGHVGLVDVETPPSTLVCPCVATLCGLCVATLDSPFERAACNFLIVFNH